ASAWNVGPGRLNGVIIVIKWGIVSTNTLLSVSDYSISSHSWVKSSATVRHLSRRALARASLTKSMLQTALGAVAIARGCRSSGGRLAFLRRRTARLASL